MIRCQMHKLNMIKDRRYHLRKYKQCFIAKDVIDWAHRSHHAQTREEAVAAMLCLQQHGMIHHVVDEHDFKDQSLFFRFTRDDGTYAANTDVAIFYRGLDVYNSEGAEIQRDFYHKGHLYEGAFYGNELVDCIMDGDNTDRKQIVNQCRELLEYDILNHVTDDYHFSDDRLLYQFRVNFDRPSLLMDVLTPQYDQKKKKVQGNRSEQRTEQQNSEAPMFTSAGSEGSSVDDVSYNNAYDSVKHDGQRLDVTVSDAGARKGSNHGVPAINYTRRGSDDARILMTRKGSEDATGPGWVRLRAAGLGAMLCPHYRPLGTCSCSRTSGGPIRLDCGGPERHAQGPPLRGPLDNDAHRPADHGRHGNTKSRTLRSPYWPCTTVSDWDSAERTSYTSVHKPCENSSMSATT
ncbi:hypothetical protein C0Q70_16411 [Pomacea canaliculata]|uniref:DEP domain-containing protein n=1 Tax=Pomacea canaliculata TaxID=400727 RepID=A0A2T7NPQ5_POMCA|nr:hypothetical protein C0Q70_16411 [Pomacea canaliculata]